MNKEKSADNDSAEKQGVIVATIAAKTHVGLVRERNEDAVLIGDLESRVLFDPDEVHVVEVEPGHRGPFIAVCDGMGGGEHGHIAATVAAQTAWRELCGDAPTLERPVFARQLRRSIRAANLAVRERAISLSSRKMGTTAAVCGMVDGALEVALVGDCRASIFRAGALCQITRDQSVVSALVSAGSLTSAEARASERRHMILQALGPEADVDVALSLVELRRGDILLVSSDGVHGVLEERFLVAGLTEHPDDLLRALERMFSLAISAGAPDNATAVLLKFDGPGLPALTASDRQPRFTEIDPNEDGEAALTTTSRVGRRLAHRAGLRSRLTAPPIPATGTHAVITDPIEAGDALPESSGLGPAEKRLARAAGGTSVFWIAVFAVVFFLVAFFILA